MADPSAESLQPLLDLLKEGAPAARQALLAHSQERLRLLTRRMLRKFPGVRRWENTSDVFQNLLVRLDRALQEVSPPTPGDFLALASAHIRWELIDLSRRHNGPHGLNAHHATPPLGDEGLPMPVDPAGPNEDPFGLAVWHEFHTRIASLPEVVRRLFDVLYYQGVPQGEAAAMLDIPLTTLRRRWQEAKIKLMEQMGEGFPEF